MSTECVVLDTETTGLSFQEDRVIEIGAIKVRKSDRKVLSTFHVYLNPGERKSSEEAIKVHGITNEFLEDKPKFIDVYHAFLGFVTDCTLVIHNAAFDMGFLQAELDRVSYPVKLDAICPVEDTLMIARKQYPGQKNNLDALCNKFGIDISHRTLHGALKDADLLVKVYFALLTNQASFVISDRSQEDDVDQDTLILDWSQRAVIIDVNPEEEDADSRFFDSAG